MTMSARLVILFGLIGVVALVLGRGQSPHPALDGFAEGCEGATTPCWEGIMPGMTSGAEVRAIGERIGSFKVSGQAESFTSYIRNLDAPFICSVMVRVIENVVTWLGVYYCNGSNVMIGDVAARLGLPQRVTDGAAHSVSYGGEGILPDVGRAMYGSATVVNIMTANGGH